MNRIILTSVFIIIFQICTFAGPEKAGVIVKVSSPGIADIISGGKTSAVKAYTEISAGDIIQIKKSGKIVIILSNFEKVILKKKGKVIINDDLSIKSFNKNGKIRKRKDRFSEDIARDLAMNHSYTAGAARGDGEITKKVKSEIAGTDTINNDFLKHTARYYIYRKYNIKSAMAKEAKILSEIKKSEREK